MPPSGDYFSFNVGKVAVNVHRCRLSINVTERLFLFRNTIKNLNSYCMYALYTE